MEISVDSQVGQLLHALKKAGVTFEADQKGVIIKSDGVPSDALIIDMLLHRVSLQKILSPFPTSVDRHH